MKTTVKTLEKIPVLAARQPWAGLIALGQKTIIVRTRTPPKKYIGKKIAIYAAKSRPGLAQVNKLKREISQSAHIDSPRCDVKGSIIATAVLSKVSACRSLNDFAATRNKHYALNSDFKPLNTWFWHLEDIQPIEPVEFGFEGMVWSVVDAELLAGRELV